MNLPPFEIDRPRIRVSITLQVVEQDGRAVCGLYELKGKIDLPPRAWLKTVRAEMKVLEQKAREAGCAEMRIAGRNWARIFPEYERLIGVPNGLRKAL